MKSENEQVGWDQSPKPRRTRFREVGSRFLSPVSTTSHESGIPSPNSQSPSANPRKPMNAETKKQHKSLDEPGFARGLWPSSTTPSSSKSNKISGTLGDHLGNEGFKDRKRDKKPVNDNGALLIRQGSSNDFGRLENEKDSAKENSRPKIGGSTRYTERLPFSGKSSSLLRNASPRTSGILPGRLSVDENELYRKTYARDSDSFLETSEFDSERGNMGSPALGKSSAAPRKSGIEVSSRFMNGVSGRRVSDLDTAVSFDSSSTSTKFNIKNAIKRMNSLTNAKSQWALSPGRSVSPPLSVENKGRPTSFSGLKPSDGHSKATGMEKLLNIGLDLFKGKKSSSSSSSTPAMSGNSESVHQIRLLHNRLMQWRYANARAVEVNGNITLQAERNLISARDGLKMLRNSVVQKKLKLDKEKLDMKLSYILYSQKKLLEAWGDMERRHVSAVSKTQQGLQTVVCRVPLTDGAMVDIQSASINLAQALDLTPSFKSTFTSFAATAESNVMLLSELAKVVSQERLLLEECLEHFRTVCTLELQERSLRCNIIQLEM